MPPPIPGKKKNTADVVVSLTVDGNTYEIRPSEIDGRLAMQIRRATGASLRSLLEIAGDDPDIDVIAALVWVARRQSGEDVEFDDVAATITYGSEIEAMEQVEDADPGEACAAS